MRIVIDTNIWIGYLIGKRLSFLKPLLTSGKIIVIASGELLKELKEVTQRAKFRKHFHLDKVDELVHLMQLKGEHYDVEEILPICRDSKDDFLLALCKVSRADYLVTGDLDLLSLLAYEGTVMLRPSNLDKKLFYEEVEYCAKVMRSLSHPTRLKILEIIDKENEVNMVILEKAFSMSKAALSQHISILRQGGILQVLRKGKTLNFRINYPILQKVEKALSRFKTQN